MKYYLDTEFLEGTQKKWFGSTEPTIDLISIGIVCEDGREYYAINKDFNLKEAWNRWQPEYDDVYIGDGKKYWIRDNVLKPIFIELRAREVEEYNIAKIRNVILNFPTYSFCYKELKRLINKYGKSNKQIAQEVKNFVAINDRTCTIIDTKASFKKGYNVTDYRFKNVEFYGYYSDYDWVVFCCLFGKMVDLPKGFPMYCIDLKQELDRIQEIKFGLTLYKGSLANDIKTLPNYPKQTNEHNALSDARWNKQLHEFLNKL